jgi:anti-sigma-K factor RskA
LEGVIGRKEETWMSQQSNDEVLMRNYLLGELDEGRQEQVEERLLYDDDFAEKLSTAQDALIDDYVFDALPEGERQSFEKNFVLNDERRDKILFAQTFEIYVDERYGQQPPTLDNAHPPPPSWRNPLPFLRAHKAWAAISAIVALLLFLTPTMVRWIKPPPDQVALLRARRASIERQIAEVNNRPTNQSSQAPTSELVLQPTLLREDSGIKRVILTEDIKLLTLKLTLPQAQHENYRALVLTVEGDELFAIDGLRFESDAGVATVLLKIPSEFLMTGDYQIQLRGEAADGSVSDAVRYNFRVINKK